VGTTIRVRLGRDYYVRIAGNDYSVNPTVIGRFVDVHAGLTEVVASCAGRVVASHVRCWASRQTITDPTHVEVAAGLRTAYQARTAALRGSVAATGTGTEVGVRALSDYDELFALATPSVARPDVQVLR
jgi:hypothetical protein